MKMNTPTERFAGVSHAQELSRLADSWNITEDELRGRIAHLRDRVEKASEVEHIALERLAENALTDTDTDHLSSCKYCAELQAAVLPVENHVEVFTRRAAGSFSPPRPKRELRRAAWIAVPAALVAFAVFIMPKNTELESGLANSAGNQVIWTQLAERLRDDPVEMASPPTCGAAERNAKLREAREHRATEALEKVNFNSPLSVQYTLPGVVADYCAAGKPEIAVGVTAALMVAKSNPKQAEAYVEAAKLAVF